MIEDVKSMMLTRNIKEDDIYIENLDDQVFIYSLLNGEGYSEIFLYEIVPNTNGIILVDITVYGGVQSAEEYIGYLNKYALSFN